MGIMKSEQFVTDLEQLDRYLAANGDSAAGGIACYTEDDDTGDCSDFFLIRGRHIRRVVDPETGVFSIDFVANDPDNPYGMLRVEVTESLVATSGVIVMARTPLPESQITA